MTHILSTLYTYLYQYRNLPTWVADPFVNGKSFYAMGEQIFYNIHNRIEYLLF